MPDIDMITGVANAYTFPPYKLEEMAKTVGQVQFLYTIKAMVTYLDHGVMHYKLYRCGWNGTPNSDSSPDGWGVPQGLPLTGTANEIQAIAMALFSVLVHGGAIPDPFEYGELEEEDNDDKD